MDTIVGIDLGTTNSVISIVENGHPRVIAESGETMLPSVVGVDASGGLIVGHPARNQLILAPERTVKSIKRRMGQADTVSLGGQDFTPQEVSAVILRKLKQRAETDLGRAVTRAVITVPAFFNEVQREATRAAGELAGLDVVRIINEPTAASLAYNATPDLAERLLVYDLGGGTFDVSVVQIEAGVVEVLASHGDTRLGGDDFDELLLHHVCDAFQVEHKVDLRNTPRTRSRLLAVVENAKKQLSTEGVVQIEEEFIVEHKGVPLHLNMELKRFDYEDMILPLLEKTLVCLDQTLEDADLTAGDIDRVVLVGGSTRTPLVHRLLNDRLGLPLHTDVDPDLCVAAGAAVQAALIAGHDVDAVLVDITPHTLGIACLGYVNGRYGSNKFARLIRRNSPLPVSETDVFTTAHDGQDAVHIEVYQGENDNVRNNDLVGEFELEDLVEAEAGHEILVRFDLDLDGILTVTASERTTGNEKQLTIDNAVERFRQRGGAAARIRLDEAFAASRELRSEVLPGSTALPVAATPVAEPIPEPELFPEFQATLNRAQEVLRQGSPLLEQAAAEDADELRALLARLQTAVDNHAGADMKAILTEAEDLIFYLQDA
jgi:molecular chaperone DnaK